MPGSKYIKVLIGGQQVDLKSTEELPAAINYKLEDPENFQSKKSAEVFDLEIPATTINDQIANTFHNPGIDDNTPGQQKRSFQSFLVDANGYELFKGKALLKNAKHDSLPISYNYDGYGNNGDWLVAMRETPLFELLKNLSFTLTKELIEASWAFDGTDENLPYVFAPVRYGQPMETLDGKADFNMTPLYMKPAISVYWLLYWGFKSQGYRIQSDFFDTNYFRRLVMPWTWGNFLFSEGTRMDQLDFLAKTSMEGGVFYSNDMLDHIDVFADNETTNGAFDNNGVYEYDPVNFEMKWTYITGLGYGLLSATFHVQAFVDAIATANSDVELTIEWYKNGTLFKSEKFVDLHAPAVGNRTDTGLKDVFATVDVQENDVISAKFFLHLFDSGLGHAEFRISIDAFELDYFNIPLGGIINFANYNTLKKYKWIDFLAGIVDSFNLTIQTDPINKVVVIEPMHPYALDYDQGLTDKDGGYFNGNHLNWESKQDISKVSEVSLFSDADRELMFKFKSDTQDGILKKVQDRHGIELASSKYVFGDRFKAGVKEHQNRFFSPVMHWRADQWGNIGATPQLIVMIPENVSNTSRDEAQNTFNPKLAWYKGLVDMGWVWDGVEKDDLSPQFPYMFAVNYSSLGAHDPILSYTDEWTVHMSDGLVPSPGLLRRFFLQRMAILRNGQYYDTWFRLNNLDVTNFLHREHIGIRGQKCELIEIKDFKPLQEESTGVLLRKHSDITETDSTSIYPSKASVATDGLTPADAFDQKYFPLRCLYSDVPATITD